MSRTSSRTPTRARRRTAEETRELMLRAGTELATARLQTDEETAASHALAHIRLTEVAREATALAGAPITTGAIYQLWSTQAEFQADLMLHVLTEAPLPAADAITRITLEGLAAGRGVDEIIHELSVLAFSSQQATPAYALALLFVPYARVARVGDALRQTYAELMAASLPIYNALLNYGRLKIREPWTVQDLAIAISSLHEGYGVRHRIEPGAVTTRDGVLVVAEASVALVHHFTEDV